MRILTHLLAFTLLASCNTRQTDMENTITKPDTIKTDTSGKKKITYLALGDSYTIGEAVPAEGNFPNQLASRIPTYGINMVKPIIIARTGWTTDELISAIKQQAQAGTFDVVTLLIGVNNQYRGYNINTYRTEFKELLNTAVKYAGGNKQHVFVLSIPDYSVTPFAQNSDRDKIASEIDQYNAVNQQETEKAGISYINITPISRQAIHQPDLIATDGLHPSAKMYTAWINMLLPTIAERY